MVIDLTGHPQVSRPSSRRELQVQFSFAKRLADGRSRRPAASIIASEPLICSGTRTVDKQPSLFAVLYICRRLPPRSKQGIGRSEKYRSIADKFILVNDKSS